MALVHQMLYQSQDLSYIDLSEYERELAQLPMDSRGRDNIQTSPPG